MVMDKILVICGPTATGKTKLTLELAKKFEGEIISADSRQIYQGMDIGTGKDLPPGSKYQASSIKYHEKTLGFWQTVTGEALWLLDLAKPDSQFTVADYLRCAHLVRVDIQKRGKLPILVGGTGLYIKSFLDGLGTLGIGPDWEFRGRLEKVSLQTLQDRLKKINPEKWEAMNESDKKNPRRLIRALEIAGHKAPIKLNNKPQNLDSLFVGLTAPNKFLYRQIDRRVIAREKQGLEREIRDLLKQGYSWTNSVLGTTIGYREWQPYFAGEMTKRDVITKWQLAEHGYARRQLTWFRKEKRIKWFTITQPHLSRQIEKTVSSWYNA